MSEFESELKVCGHYFRVKIVENLRDHEGNDAWGRIHIGLQTIELERNCSDTKKKKL